MKLDSRGYIVDKTESNGAQIRKIQRDLTVKPFIPGKRGKFTDNSYQVYLENDTEMAIPRFYGVDNFGTPTQNLLGTKVKKITTKYSGKMRPRQEITVSNVMEGLKTIGGGILIAGCGSGKTNMAIYVACQLKYKTLFVVHKDFLRDQIKERIISFTNCKSVGIIQAKKMDTDHDFVIAMVQTCIKREISPKILKQFGLIIFDEVHHMAARNFHQMFYKICPPHILGLTAETNRPDGLFKVVNWFIGPILHQEPQRKNNKVIVKMFWFSSKNEEKTKIVFDRFKEPDRPKMITNISQIPERNTAAYNIVFSLFDQEHTILVLGSRKEQLNQLFDKLEKNTYTKGSSGLYHGDIPKEALNTARYKQIILATYDMIQEGFDNEFLTAILLLSPRGKINQSTGRILRKDTYDYNPLIITLCDEKPEIFHSMYNTQIDYFKNQHYTIYKYHISDDKKKKDGIYYQNLEAIDDVLTNHNPDHLFWQYKSGGKKKAIEKKEEKNDLRILITGDRQWKDEDIVRGALEWLQESFPGKKITIVHGACTGADNMVAAMCGEFEFKTEAHPANWDLGRYAGPKRNSEMVATKPDYVFAFHNNLQFSTGTKDTVNKAHRADIPVRLFTTKMPGGYILPNIKVQSKKPAVAQNFFAKKLV